ncbi:MAG: penicillin-binding protein 2 [Gammaproteobacteria bacterium]
MAGLPPLDTGGRKHYAGRLTIVAIIAALLGAGLVARMAWLQIMQASHYASLARGNRIRVQPIAPTRGLIYDRNGRILAENVPTYELTLVPDQVEDIAQTLKRLGHVIQLTPQDIEDFNGLRATKRGFQPIPLKTDLSPQELARFAVRRQDFPGVDVRAALKRYYPPGTDAAAAVGYVGLISQADLAHLNAGEYSASAHVGKTGVERQYEQVLHGEIGYEKVEVNATGRTLRVLETHPPKDGDNVYLTLDDNLQRIARRALGDHAGAVVAIQPATGAVLCLASKPSFDPNLFVNGISKADYQALLNRPGDPLVDRALRGRYAPGSTIKPFIGLAALHYNVLTPSTTIYSGPTFRLPNYSHIFHDVNPHQNGKATIAEALIRSIDTFFYQVAQQLGIDKMHDFLDQFGFGETPAIDLPGALAGVNPSPAWKERALHQAWYPGDTVNNGIGQGFLLVTPLQLASAVATLAEHGRRMRPHVLGAVVDTASEQRIAARPDPLPFVALPDPAYWDYIVNALHEVITNPHGTAHNIAKGLDFPMAGKTGSAQVVSVYRKESVKLADIPPAERTNGLFIAFAPLDHPEIAVAVVVEHGGYGAQSAAPIARKIITAWLKENAKPASTDGKHVPHPH